MKKILGILILLTIFSSAVHAAEEISVDMVKDESLEEVKLETHLNFTAPKDTQTATITEEVHEPTLRDKLRDIYSSEVENPEAINPLLANITTYKFEKGPLDNFHIWAAVQSHGTVDMPDNSDVDTTYGVGLININLDGQFKGKKEDFRLMLDPTHQHNRGFMHQLIQDAYIATNRIPHHRVTLGHVRPGVGIEGAQSPYTLPFINRSQISRTFGTVRKFGARVQGNYSLIDYDLGGYSSDTFLTEFFPGVEFDGWVNLKPLGKTNGKYGKLVTGGGITAGNRHSSDFFVAGAYAGYEYKRLSACFEWAHADGYNGAAGLSTKKASGFYTTLGYKVTPKVQLLARYDQFDPDTTVNHNNKREYSIGLNYFIKGQGLRMIFNYVFCQNDATADSHRLMLGTQVLL